MKTPEIQSKMHELARMIEFKYGLKGEAAHLHDLAVALYRRKPVRRAPVQHVTDKEKKKAARVLAAVHPEWSYQDIGEKVGLNAGRVSEAVAGFRR